MEVAHALVCGTASPGMVLGPKSRSTALAELIKTLLSASDVEEIVLEWQWRGVALMRPATGDARREDVVSAFISEVLAGVCDGNQAKLNLRACAMASPSVSLQEHFLRIIFLERARWNILRS